tara:strand:+ start:3842 stop:4033 length:192 start_codon:yes stop_codon:yes gene_type:complete
MNQFTIKWKDDKERNQTTFYDPKQAKNFAFMKLNQGKTILVIDKKGHKYEMSKLHDLTGIFRD